MLVRTRLSVMMFLQYFVWGAWFVTLSTYLSTAKDSSGARVFSDTFIGAAFGTAAIAAMIAPFFVGMIADRFFSTERILFVLHVVGGLILYWLASVLNPTTLYRNTPAEFISILSNNYRQTDVNSCKGFKALSHYLAASWDVDQGQRIGAATEIEGGGGGPTVPAPPTNLRVQ